MPLVDATYNVLSDYLGTLITHISIHTAQPDDAGSDEVTGGAPAYARKPITWLTAVDTQIKNEFQLVFDVPAGTYTHLGYWSALTTGTFYGWEAFSAPQVYAVQGTLPVPVQSIILDGSNN